MIDSTTGRRARDRAGAGSSVRSYLLRGPRFISNTLDVYFLLCGNEVWYLLTTLGFGSLASARGRDRVARNRTVTGWSRLHAHRFLCRCASVVRRDGALHFPQRHLLRRGADQGQDRGAYCETWYEDERVCGMSRMPQTCAFSYPGFTV